MKTHTRTAFGLLTFVCAVGGAAADDRSEYNKRAAERFVSLFQTLDRSGDRVVARDEARGDLNFEPYFSDMDINRDGFVTAEELQRFIESRFNVIAVQAAK